MLLLALILIGISKAIDFCVTDLTTEIAFPTYESKTYKGNQQRYECKLS